MQRSAALLVLAAALASACAPAPVATPEPAQLTISGSTSMRQVLTELSAAFQSQYPNVVVDVESGGSGTGLAELRRGRVDVAASSWVGEGQPTPDGLQLTPLARDDVAIVVHPTNPITNITSLQLRALYRGETLDWSLLAGFADATEIISREEGSGTRAAFEALAMGGDRVTLNARVMPTSRTVVDFVAGHPAAIGYVTVAEVDERVRTVPVEGVNPSLETTRAGSYALTRWLHLATGADPSPQAAAFIAFATSRPAQKIIAQFHTPVR